MLFETNSVSIILYRGITGLSLFAVDHQEIHCCYQFHVDFLCFFFVHMSSVIQTSQDICTHCRFCFGALFCPGIERFWQYYEYPVTVRQLLRTWINTSAWLPGDWQYNYNNTEHNKKVTIPRRQKNTIKKIIETKDSVADLFSLKSEIWWKYISLCTYVGKSRRATVVDIHILYYGCILSP